MRFLQVNIPDFGNEIVEVRSETDVLILASPFFFPFLGSCRIYAGFGYCRIAYPWDWCTTFCITLVLSSGVLEIRACDFIER